MYCVHCGVRLEDSESHCPICGTVSVDPNEPKRITKPVYPAASEEQTLVRNKKKIALILSWVFLFPALLCFLLDLMVSPGITWSIFPTSALVLLWLAIGLPVIAKRHRFFLSAPMDIVLLNAYLLLVDTYTGGKSWFLPIALPFLLYIGIVTIGLVALFRKFKPGIFAVIGSILIAMAAGCFLLETLIGLWIDGTMSFIWWPYVAAPGLFIGITMVICSKDPEIMAFLRKRLFY